MLRRAAVRCAAGPAVPSAPLRGRIPAATMLEPGVAAGSPELDTGGGHTQRNTHHARRWASVMPLPPPPLQPKLGAGCHLWARRDLMQSGHCTPVTLWRGAQRSISGGNSARGRDGGGDELAQFLLHGKMVLQTATVALETGDAEKIRGAKEVCSNFVEAYVGVCRAAPASPQRRKAEEQLEQLRDSLRHLVDAERGRFEIGVLGQGNNAPDNVLEEYRKKTKPDT